HCCAVEVGLARPQQGRAIAEEPTDDGRVHDDGGYARRIHQPQTTRAAWGEDHLARHAPIRRSRGSLPGVWSCIENYLWLITRALPWAGIRLPRWGESRSPLRHMIPRDSCWSVYMIQR